MGLEEHLLGMFREDFEFHDGAAPSHLGSGHAQRPTAPAPETDTATAQPAVQMTTHAPASASEASTAAVLSESSWAPEAEKELKKIPFFVRGKARRNTESFARERGIENITVEIMYEAKAHFSR
jgi:light-independent protochlorophyllide reductase subunit B